MMFQSVVTFRSYVFFSIKHELTPGSRRTNKAVEAKFTPSPLRTHLASSYPIMAVVSRISTTTQIKGRLTLSLSLSLSLSRGTPLSQFCCFRHRVITKNS